MLWAIPAIAAAVGLIKGLTVDQSKEQRDEKLAAATQFNSPWTGLKAGPISRADPLGSTLGFGLGGMQMANGLATAQNNGALVQHDVNSLGQAPLIQGQGGYGTGQDGFLPSKWGQDPYGQNIWGGMQR